MKKLITIASLFLSLFTTTISYAAGVISNHEKILIVLKVMMLATLGWRFWYLGWEKISRSMAQRH